MRVAVVGMGSIGRAWTISFLRAGFDVSVWNRNENVIDEALISIESVLSELADKGLLNGQHPHILMSRIQRCHTLAEAVKGATYVQENAAERLDVKQSIFQQMDASAETYAILATSTSGIVPSAFTERLRSRDRCIVAHPLNPPYLIPAVDIVPSPWTSQETVVKTLEIMKLCWQKPILMQHEDPGFITIRLQAMMYHECWRLVKSGLATPEDVDVAVREGLGLRWSFIGPFETADLNAPGGIRDFVGRFGDYLKALYPNDGPVEWSGHLLDRVEQARRSELPLERLKVRQAWRDRRLLALAAHKKEQADEELQ